MPATKTEPYSQFMRDLQAGQFVFTGELEPDRSADLSPLIQEAQEIKQYVAAANVTDIPGSFVSMNGLASAVYIHERTGLDLIYQQTCRDLSRLGLASALLSASAVGIRNILTLSGDHPILGDIPASKPVFDLDSTQLLQLAREMTDNQTIYGVPIEHSDITPVQFHVGIGANPNSTHPEIELLKLKKKVQLGAEFIQTQVIYDLETVEPFLKDLKQLGIPVIIGVFPMRNYATARDFDKYVPGVSIPKPILAAFKEAKQKYSDKKQKKAAYDKINVDLFKPMLAELKKKGYAAGAHITAVHYTRIFPQLI
jgi:5,10-methylenetetrahydrofolate reductase